MLETGVLDMKPMLTKTKYLDELYVGFLAISGMLITLVTLAIIALVLFKSGVNKVGTQFLRAGGALSFLPMGSAAPLLEPPS